MNSVSETPEERVEEQQQQQNSLPREEILDLQFVQSILNSPDETKTPFQRRFPFLIH